MYYNKYDNSLSSEVQVLTTIGSPDTIVTLDQAKEYIRITNTEEDSLITAMIQNAILQAEQYLSRDILSKTRRMYVNYADRPFNLFYAPVASVQTVAIDGTSTTAYELLGLQNPLVKLDQTNAEKVTVDYTTAGIADQSVRQGILALIAWLYHRGDASMPTNWKTWLSPFKTYGFYGNK